MTSAKTQRGESWLLFRSLWLFCKTSEHCSYHHHGEHCAEQPGRISAQGQEEVGGRKEGGGGIWKRLF